jgi:hypothetical protein
VTIAVAYFAILITMAVVLPDRHDDIPYPWLWTLFVTFIVACGMTHVAHVLAAAAGPMSRTPIGRCAQDCQLGFAEEVCGPGGQVDTCGNTMGVVGRQAQ